MLWVAVHQQDLVSLTGKADAQVNGTTLDGSIRVFDTEIPRSVRAAEASGEGKSIFAFDPKGRVAQAYGNLTKEVAELGKEANRSRSDGAR